jgi:predicted Zn-dependent protease
VIRHFLTRVCRVFWRPWVLVLGFLLLLAGGLGGRQVWAWYHYRAASAALERYRHDEARSHLDKCLEVWPTSVPIHLLAARAARRAQAYPEAEKLLNDCRRLALKAPDEVTLEWSLLRASMGNLAEVEEFLVSQADKNPAQAPLIWEALAEGYLRMYRILDALSCLDNWLAREPNNPQAWFLRGNVHTQVNAVQKYVDDYRHVVELDPTRADARRLLAIGLVELGRYDEALAHLEYVRQRQPDDPEVLVRLARCQSGLGQGKQARELLDNRLKAHPDDGLALRTLGEINLQESRPAEAEAALRRAVRVLPNDYRAQWSLYQALQRQEGKTAAADAQLARADQIKERTERLAEIRTRKMSQDPHNPALHCELGTLLLGLGQKELGERWLLSALNEKPDYAPAHQALAAYYEEQGDAEKAAYHRQEASAATTKTPTPPPGSPAH